MAKRKRLEPAGLIATAPETLVQPTSRSPIAQVAAEAAGQAALQDLAAEVTAAREEGRMVVTLPLEAVEEGHLVRDRLAVNTKEMTALVDSIRARGQQAPVEVVDLGAGRYGLISGWRRMQALRRLAGAGQGDGTVLALLRRPETAADAYQAMVDENEIRVGLSYYERARIVARAVEEGVYPTIKAALNGLFATASRTRRSKIKSFLPIYDGLDASLGFAGAIPERLGLTLAKRLKDDPGFASKLRATLSKVDPDTAEAEAKVMRNALKQSLSSQIESKESSKIYRKREIVPGIALQLTPQGLVLSGDGVTDGLRSELEGWLVRR